MTIWWQGAAANVALRRRLSDKDKERRLVSDWLIEPSLSFSMARGLRLRALETQCAKFWRMCCRCGGAAASEKTRRTGDLRAAKTAAMWVVKWNHVEYSAQLLVSWKLYFCVLQWYLHWDYIHVPGWSGPEEAKQRRLRRGSWWSPASKPFQGS